MDVFQPPDQAGNLTGWPAKHTQTAILLRFPAYEHLPFGLAGRRFPKRAYLNPFETPASQIKHGAKHAL